MTHTMSTVHRYLLYLPVSMMVKKDDDDDVGDDYDYDSDNISPSLVTFLHIKDGQTAVHSVVNPVFSARADCLVGIMIIDGDCDDDGGGDNDYDDSDPVLSSWADCLVRIMITDDGDDDIDW